MKMQIKYIFVIIAIPAAASADAQTYADRQYKSYQAQSEATRRAYSVPQSTYKAPSSSQSSSNSNSSSASSSSRSNNSSANYSRPSGSSSSRPEQNRIPENMKWYPAEKTYAAKPKPDCLGDCSETISFDEGEYTGNTKGGRAHGRGTLTLKDGAKYIGTWTDGKLSGDSKIFSANGDRYEGGYSNHAMNGWGRYTYSDGDYQEGNWVNGVNTSADNSGEAISDLMIKWGVSNFQFYRPTAASQTFANGTVYTGEVYNRGPYRGKYTRTDGSGFEGLLDKNGFYVNGKKTEATGETFEGEFKEGKFYRGTYTAKGNSFTGEFAGNDDNYKAGRMTFKDGVITDRFYGNNNQKDGYTRTRFTDGGVNESMYAAGKFTGGVIIVFASGSTFTGMGNYEGYALYGTLTYDDGRSPLYTARNANNEWTDIPEADHPKAGAAAAKGKADVEKGRAMYREAVKFNPALAL